MRLFICAVLISGCGGLTVDGPVPDVQESALSCNSNTCRGSVTSGVTSLPSENTYFCHPLMMSGSGAHSQAPVLQWGVPAWGGVFGLSASNSSPSMAAIPNAAGPLPHAGQAVTEAQCDKWTNFHGNGSHGYSGEWLRSWTNNGQLQFVSATDILWDIQSACYVAGVGSFYTGEKIDMGIANGWNWDATTSGHRALSSTVRCAWLGRQLGTVQFLDTAVHGNFADSGLPTSAGICLLYHVEGNLDDGYVNQNRATGTWRLEISGGVTRAKMYCFPY